VLLLQLVTFFFASLLKCAVKVFNATLVKVGKKAGLGYSKLSHWLQNIDDDVFAGALLHNHIFTQ
jgi:hypothetical protein